MSPEVSPLHLYLEGDGPDLQSGIGWEVQLDPGVYPGHQQRPLWCDRAAVARQPSHSQEPGEVSHRGAGQLAGAGGPDM